MTKPIAVKPKAGPSSALPRRTQKAVPVRDKAVRDPERTSAAILAAAVQEFTEHGYGGARINEIAARADVNKRMLYHYYGGKEALYLAVLEGAYVAIRSAETRLHLADRDPVDGMRELALFTWHYFIEHPEFLSLLNTENLLKAKHLKRSARIFDLHSPLVSVIRDLLKRGADAGQFRPDADPVQVYISIAALGFFYLSNRYTLSTIFRRDLTEDKALTDWGDHIVNTVLSYLRP
ncbi:TetR/AcrR family transcriptional regulator [Lacibacterium aquatile]|uniref:TetR/AcrR family transcriptional regulator n=1 Tax=Lacibacterium aquatile TaxID=1168082 RepID=A0ABW5DVG2_9PROT